MKRIALFLLLLSTLACKAVGEEYNGFTYKVNVSTIEIRGYNGPSGSIIVPTEIEGKPVTNILKLVSSESKNKYSDIFIPNTVTYIGILSDNHSPLKSVVIDTDVYIQCASAIIFNNAYETNLNNIILFGSDEKKTNPLGTTKTPWINNGNLEYINKVEIQFKGQAKSLYAHIYLYGQLNTTEYIFGEERFQYLLSALEKRGTNLEDITCIDFSKVKASKGHTLSFSFDDSFNPASLLPSEATVILPNRTYTSIPDLVDFSAPSSDKSNVTISYSRTNTQNWNSVCLPFDIEESYFPNGTKIYTYDSSSETSITLRRTTDKVVAGRPCFIYSEADSWNLNIPNASISNGVQAQTESIGDWQLVGSFERRTIGQGKYKLTADGTEMNSTTSDDATVAPFRCYVEATSASGNAPARLSVGVDEELPITVILNDEPEKKVMLYDLMGRPNSGRSTFQISTDKKQIMIRK